MKKVKSIVMKVLAMMGENEVRAWGIGIKCKQSKIGY